MILNYTEKKLYELEVKPLSSQKLNKGKLTKLCKSSFRHKKKMIPRNISVPLLL